MKITIISFILVSMSFSVFGNKDLTAEIFTSDGEKISEIVIASEPNSIMVTIEEISSEYSGLKIHIESDTEENMSFELWMTELDDGEWAIEPEDEMSLENWMLNPGLIQEIETDYEEEMNLESWMTDPNSWNQN